MLARSSLRFAPSRSARPPPRRSARARAAASATLEQPVLAQRDGGGAEQARLVVVQDGGCEEMHGAFGAARPVAAGRVRRVCRRCWRGRPARPGCARVRPAFAPAARADARRYSLGGSRCRRSAGWGWAGHARTGGNGRRGHYGPATGKGRGWQRSGVDAAPVAPEQPGSGQAEGGPEQRIADQRGDHETLGQGFRRQAGMDFRAAARRTGAAAPAGRRRPASAASCRRTPAGPGPPRWRRRWRSTSTGVAPGRPRRYPAAPAAGPATAPGRTPRSRPGPRAGPARSGPARRVKRPASIRAKPTATTRLPPVVERVRCQPSSGSQASSSWTWAATPGRVRGAGPRPARSSRRSPPRGSAG